MRTWSILSISDLHYESPDSNYTDDPKELQETAFRADIFQEFNTILENGFGKEQFDLVSVAGDITTHGQMGGLKKFRAEALPKLLNLAASRESIVLVPGNHDVVWGLSPYEDDYFGKKFAAFRNLVNEEKLTSCLYPSGNLTNPRLVLERPKSGPVHVDRERRLLVLCINSAIRCGELNSKINQDFEELLRGFGSLTGGEHAKLTSEFEAKFRKYSIRDVAQITLAQRSEFIETLQKWRSDLGADWEQYLRVAILHHHLLPFRDQETEHRGYEMALDAGPLLSLLTDWKFDLVLTGHKHQHYQIVHADAGRELLIVGNPTVGGYSSGDSFRGCQIIDIEDRLDRRYVRVSRIDRKFGHGNPREEVLKARRNGTSFSLSPPPPEAVHDDRKAIENLSYREIISITKINSDGDAWRVLEFSGLQVAGNMERSRRHRLSLPPTSGYLCALSARGKGFEVKPEPLLPENQRTRRHTFTMSFAPPAGREQPADYSCEWWSLNGFALDEIQFEGKYPDESTPLRNFEFTHFVPEDPTRELTVLVQFPPERFPSELSVRVARVDKGEADSRKWEIEADAQNVLRGNHALREVEPMGIAVLRVKYPRPNLSYGIQWRVPAVTHDDEDGLSFREELRTRIDQAPPTQSELKGLLLTLGKILDLTRELFIRDANAKLDISLMYLTRQMRLAMVVAAQSEPSADGAGPEKIEFIEYAADLDYGDGIAGRAIKSNQVRVWAAPASARSNRQSSWYVALPGAPKHKVLVSVPVHVPGDAELQQRHGRIYETKTPYGVVSIGSTKVNSELKSLGDPELRLEVRRFQHGVSRLLYEDLRTILGL